jgi:hypothetical protein
VSAEQEAPIFDRHVEHVAFADAERVTKISGEHDPSERVDAASAVLRTHDNPVRPADMRSVL